MWDWGGLGEIDKLLDSELQCWANMANMFGVHETAQNCDVEMLLKMCNCLYFQDFFFSKKTAEGLPYKKHCIL